MSTSRTTIADIRNELFCGDCLEVMADWPDGCVDLVFGSPPYEDRRTYGMDFSLSGQEWVDWMFPRVVESLRICAGLVAFVVAGQTKNYRYSATPELLMADLHRAGYHLRRPPIYHRIGIPGSGGSDWLRNHYEPIICVTHGGRLRWADNTAMGHRPRQPKFRVLTPRTRTGKRLCQTFRWPELVNPGNVISGNVGGGRIGDWIAHESEAPFPEWLAEFFIRSFCPPGGIVLDPFVGSGTTCAVAAKTGREWAGIDIRPDQIAITKRRLGLFAAGKDSP